MPSQVIHGPADEPILGRGPTGNPPEDRGRGPSGVKPGETRISYGSDGLDIADIKKWHEAFAPYKNFAGNEDIARRALNWGNEHVRRHDDKTVDLQQKWRILNALMQGQSLIGYGDPEAVHVPEMYKMLETIVPRIEEAVFQYNPWFEVRGRERIDRYLAQKIRAFLEWELDENRFEDMVQPAIRCMMIYGFCAMKTWWSIETDFRVERHAQRNEQSGSVQDVFRPTETEKVVYEGPRMALVDPFWFVIDSHVTDAQSAIVVGDRREMTYDDIADLGEQGIFDNWKDLVGQTPIYDRQYSDWNREARRLTWPFDTGPDARIPQGSPQRFIVSELWGRFDLHGTGRTRECVVTIANETTLLRVQENPYDDKHRPYSVARAARHPFEFYSVGPLDHLIPLSIELDRHRQIALTAAANSAAPPIVADENSVDIPGNLWSVEPHQIIRGRPDGVKQLDVHTKLSDLRYIEDILRRDHEETSGAPRIFEGGSTGAVTATEVERKIQEGNRRIRSYIRSYMAMCRSLLSNLHSLNRQYVTRRLGFEVIGRSFAGLESYEEIGPEEFDHAVDFRFVGATGLQNVGLEATNMQRWLQIAMAVQQTDPGKVDMGAALEYLFERWVGVEPGQKILKREEPMDTMLSQWDENQLMLQGQDVATHPRDNDDQHMEILEATFEAEEWEDVHPDAQRRFVKHYLMHDQQTKTKEARASATPAQVDAVPGMPGAGTPPQMTNMGRELDAASQKSPGLLAPGMTPGPQGASPLASPGRSMDTFQTDQAGL